MYTHPFPAAHGPDSSHSNAWFFLPGKKVPRRRKERRSERPSHLGRSVRAAVLLAVAICVLHSAFAAAQDNKPEVKKAAPKDKPGKPAAANVQEIPDEPKTVDPATLMPKMLARRATVSFDQKLLKDVVEWLRTEQKIEAVLDRRDLSDAGVLDIEPFSVQLADDPLYMLLDRLQGRGVAWYLEEGIVHLTSPLGMRQHVATVSYNVGDLLDKGYTARALTNTITGALNSDLDKEVGTPILSIGDVLFVRQPDSVQRLVAGMLSALRSHGRRTFTFDPPEHAKLKQALGRKVEVNWKGTPLSAAIAELSKLAGVEIRLDHAALQSAGVRDRTPVTLNMPGQKLSTVLQAFLNDLRITWVLRDGELAITSRGDADRFMKTAVFDVSDLCRDAGESEALKETIQNQLAGHHGGDAVVLFPRPPVMVVRQTEQRLDEILELLETYRSALRQSKPRRHAVDPHEVVTYYYRLPTVMADEMMTLLPQQVRPEMWKNVQQPNGIGTIAKASSHPSILETKATDVIDLKNPAASTRAALVVQNSVLIIRQTREVHSEIAVFLRKVRTGEDPPVSTAPQGGGTFGSGYFSAPDK